MYGDWSQEIKNSLLSPLLHFTSFFPCSRNSWAHRLSTFTFMSQSHSCPCREACYYPFTQRLQEQDQALNISSRENTFILIISSMMCLLILLYVDLCLLEYCCNAGGKKSSVELYLVNRGGERISVTCLIVMPLVTEVLTVGYTGPMKLKQVVPLIINETT